jgi:hypothetical protein
MVVSISVSSEYVFPLFTFDIHFWKSYENQSKQEFKCSSVHVFMYSCVHVFKCSSVQVFKCWSVQVFKFSSFHLFKWLSVLVFRFSSVNVCLFDCFVLWSEALSSVSEYGNKIKVCSLALYWLYFTKACKKFVILTKALKQGIILYNYKNYKEPSSVLLWCDKVSWNNYFSGKKELFSGFILHKKQTHK